jgi:hypothetical protein
LTTIPGTRSLQHAQDARTKTGKLRRKSDSLAVLDWKSDISPSRNDRSGHIAQLKDYIETIGAPKGAIVYMSLGEVVWI